MDNKEEFALNNVKAVGSLIGKYHIEAVLTVSPFGTLYKVKDTEERIFTARLIPKDVFQPLKRDYFRLKGLNNKYIIRTVDCFLEDDCLVVVTEHLKWIDLRQKLLRLKTLDLVSSLELALQIAEGLSYLREEGIIHQGLHPGNLLVTEYDKVKILEPVSPHPYTKRAVLLKSGTGEMEYLAPESLTSQEINGREDIFSFGGILYFLLTGKEPYAGHSTVKLLKIKTTKDPVKPSRYNKNIPSGLEECVLRCLSRNPTQRYESFDEIIDVLRRSIQDLKVRKKRGSVKHKSRLGVLSIIIFFITAFILLFSKSDVIHKNAGNLSARIEIVAKRTDPWGNIVSFILRDGGTVYTNDGFQVKVKLSGDSYVYIINIGPDGNISALYPLSLESENYILKKGRIYALPGDKKWYKFDEMIGTEEVYIVLSKKEWRELDNVLRDAVISGKLNKRPAVKLSVLLREKLPVSHIGTDKTVTDTASLSGTKERIEAFLLQGDEIAVYSMKLYHK